MSEPLFSDDRFSFANDSLVRESLFETLMSRQKSGEQKREPISFGDLAAEEYGSKRPVPRDSFQPGKTPVNRERGL